MDGQGESRTYEFGGFRLDAARRQLLGPDASAVELPSRAFDLLLYMVRKPGDVLGKDELMQAVWPTTVVEEGNLTQCIFALRRALGDTASDHRFIATVPGRGYQFVTQVLHSNGDAAALAISTEPASARFQWSRLAIAAGVIAIAVTGSLFWRRDAPPKKATATGTAITQMSSIAVMPFVDLSAAKDMEYFADGIAEELMDSLSVSGKVRVVGRRSTFAFRDREMDVLEIGKLLDVESILEGAVRTEGSRIRINAQLVRTRDGSHLWARSFDRAFDDVLDIQGAIAREVLAVLVPRVDSASGTRAGAVIDAQQTRNPEAYRAFLRGVYFFGRDTHLDMPLARDAFLRATVLDPEFARAHAWLGRTSGWLARRSLGNIEQNLSVASVALDRAIQLDPSLGRIWWVRTHGNEDDYTLFTARAQEFEQALEANPGDADVMQWLGLAYSLLGRHEEALQLFERAHEADPAWAKGLWIDAYYMHRFGHNRPRVLELAAEMEDLSASDPRPHTVRALIAQAEGRALDWDRWHARSIQAAPRDQPAHGYLSLDYAHLGIMDAALYHARICRELNPESAASLYNESHILLHAGDIPAARAIVQRARKEKSADYLSQLAQAELLYFIDDCAGSIDSMLLARPAFGKPAGNLDLIVDSDDVPILVWCLRRQGRTARAEEITRVFKVQFAPPIDPGGNGGLLARMAAAAGDRKALIEHLHGLVESNSAVFAFVRHEPMIQPWLEDAEIEPLLATLEARRAGWQKVVPKSSMRVPIPPAPVLPGS